MVVTEYGAPLQERDLESPRPAPGHALIQVLTCGVCFSDVKIARGRMPFSDRLALPHVPGHEICGRVLECDPADGFAPGDRVVVYNVWPCGHCDRCQAGEEHICRAPEVRAGFTEPGGFRERMVVPVGRLLRVPDALSDAEAAPLTCALGTAYRAVTVRGGVTAGERAVVIGIGGVGIHALQVARAAGALAVGIDRSPQALGAALDLGLDARTAEDGGLADALMAETGGLGYDAVIDTVGRPETMALAHTLTRPGGRIVLVGYAVGRSLELPSARVVLDEVQIIGSRYARRHELERAIRLVAEGRVKMVIDRVLELRDADEAFAALEAGDVVGRLVLRVSGGGGAA